MSGFAVIYDRSNSPVDPGVLERVMQRLAHRGPDGQETWCSNSVAMGHLHFWTTPEEVNERQPLKLPELPYTIVLDGRLDNRSDIIKRMNIHPVEVNKVSDAALVLQAYVCWGTDCFKNLIGDYAIVIWDDLRKELICARDAIGDRTLFSTFNGSKCLIASEPWAMTAGLDVSNEIDESVIGYHFALQIPEDGRTIYKGINELLPAHWMKINENSVQSQKYWQPIFNHRILKSTKNEYAEQYREILETSVSCRLRSTTSPGIMLSGGLDSSSIACLGARLLAPKPLCTISYVFDKFPDCDERRYINAIKDQYETRSTQIPCDDLWPFSSWPEWPLDPNSPSANPYRLILERTYQRARDEGMRVLLTGMFGDNLYASSSEWLSDLFCDGKICQLYEEILYMVKKHGSSKVFRSKILWQTIKQVLLRIPGLDSFRRRQAPPNWLTPYGVSLLNKQSLRKDPKKFTPLISLRDATGASREIYNTNRFDIDLRYPYHDRRVIEFMLGLPAYFLYSKGVTRKVLREAMANILPESIRLRPDKSNLLSLYNYGFQQKRKDIEDQLFAQKALWRKYVKESVMINEWQSEVSKQSSGAYSTLPYLCVFFELWYKLHIKNN